mgnify:CR=1 FL=1
MNPTTIDTEGYHNPILNASGTKKKHKLVIGWTGTHSTLPYLKSLIPVLRKLELNYSFTFLVIANRNPQIDLKSFEFMKWDKESEIGDLMKIDIGLMPLSDDIWSLGKCGFKALQFMALKIPVCISPVGVNNEIVNDSVNGFLCRNGEEWYTKIEQLLRDTKLRRLLGEAGRRTVVSRYSVKSNETNFLNLFY